MQKKDNRDMAFFEPKLSLFVSAVFNIEQLTRSKNVVSCSCEKGVFFCGNATNCDFIVKMN